MAFLMRCARTGCTAVAVLAVAACEFTRSPTAITLTEDRVMLQSVLLAGDTTARALLRLIPADVDPFNPFGMPEWIPIEDATVRLVIDGDTIPMTTRLDAPANPCLIGPVYDTAPAGALLPGCYVGSVPGGLVSGAAYDLIIDLPGRGRLEGRTTIPDALVIVVPETGARIETAIPLRTYAVEWTGAMPGRNAELRVDSHDERCSVHIAGDGGFFTFGFDWLPVTGQAADVRFSLQCTEFSQSAVPGDIVLTTFDSVYTRFRRMTSEHHHMSDARAGFTGPAIGVFGSAASARQGVQFVGPGTSLSF
jgi:hypothetical protein